MVKILFFGSSINSAIVRKALEQAGYPIKAYKFVSDRKSIYINDLVISADYGHKLPPDGLNLHPSLLPKYRGPTPVPNAILNNDQATGITIIKMVEAFDAGPILAQEKVPILPDDTSPDLLSRCFAAGAKLLIKLLPDYLNNKCTQKMQDESQATYTHKFTKQDGFITWTEFKKYCLEIGNWKLEIARKVRALYPWPGVWTKLPTGKILKLLPKNMFQLEAKQPITGQQFLAGYQQFIHCQD